MCARYSLTKKRLRPFYALMALVCLSLLTCFATTRASAQLLKPPIQQYDEILTNTIATNYVVLLDRQKGIEFSRGEVTLQFHLTDDGLISGMAVLKDTVRDHLFTFICEKAVLRGAPYAPWSSDMRHLVGNNYRVITYTFYHNDTTVIRQDLKKWGFQQYDETFTNTITTNWIALLDKQKGIKYKNGEVTLQFHLTYLGNITDITVLKNTVGDDQSLVCQKAVLAGVPYGPWPTRMHHLVGSNYRVVTFTFYYKGKRHWW